MPLMDAIDLLKHDHRIVEQMFRDYQAAGSERQRRGVVEIIIRELSKHAALEELMFYPLAKKVLPDGEKEIDEHLAEHLSVKKTLAALDGLSAGDERTDDLMAELQREIDRLQGMGAGQHGHQIDALWQKKKDLMHRIEQLT